MNEHIFHDTTLYITHYNRSASLERLLETIIDLNCVFAEIVISDDGSKPEHINHIKNLQEKFKFRLVSSPVNRGLGNNLNKGLETIETPFILYIQEDFIPTQKFVSIYQSSLDILESDKDIDLIRFYASTTYPYQKFFNADYVELDYHFWKLDYHKIYVYGDQPHVRRNTFLKKFGKYKEGIHGDKTEYAMCISFLQNKGRALLYKDFKSLFTHNNTIFEPSTMARQPLKNSNKFAIRLLRDVYRFIKYNFDIVFMKM